MEDQKGQGVQGPQYKQTVGKTHRAGASPHRGLRDKQPNEADTVITAIAQSMLTGPPVTLSSANLSSKQGSEVGATPAHPIGGQHIRRQDADDNDQR